MDFIGDSICDPTFSAAVLASSFFKGRVKSSANHAVGGVGLWRNVDRTSVTNSMWYQYTNHCRPRLLAKAAEEQFIIIVVGFHNDADLTPDELCPPILTF